RGDRRVDERSTRVLNGHGSSQLAFREPWRTSSPRARGGSSTRQETGSSRESDRQKHERRNASRRRATRTSASRAGSEHPNPARGPSGNSLRGGGFGLALGGLG